VANFQAYARQPAVALPGAGRLHLPQEQGEAYERIVELLRQNRCSTFVSYPGLNSIYLWSSLSAPKPQLPGPWMRLLDDRRQREVVEQLRGAKRPCAIRNESIAAMWLQGHSVDNAPLVRYISENFEFKEEIGGFQFLVPRRGA
jgi:hypothetical protein